MKPWHEVVVPHPDIRAGKFDESVFAADLADVVADRGPLEYRDAETFFRKTYPTRGLVELLSTVLARLSGQGTGEAVIQIQTPFGGGKTHSLIALYHLFTAGQRLADQDLVSQTLKAAAVGDVPSVRVTTFVGTAADPLKGKTPWGELAEQLGRYDLLREHDQRRQAPGKDLLHELLRQQPTLILMDEIAEYVVKAKGFGGQVLAFFQELTETAKVLPRCALVVTLPSSAPYGEEGERALNQLQQIFGRVEAIYTPVEGEEVYELIRRRLLEDAGDPAEARRTADGYLELYQRLGDDVPREVREPAYREKLRKAYPFHPELIDLLFERWSTFSTFQRTRGVLRLLAEVLADLYRRQHPAPLVQPAHLNLANAAIRREFLKHIGNEYEGVIASDIVDGNARARKIDREAAGDYARFGVATGLATAIFSGSFSGSEKKGLGIQRLRLAALREGMPAALVGDALGRLEEELWYLHAESGLYAFSNQPNLNRIIVEKEEQVQDEQIAAAIRERLERLAGSELSVTLWPKSSQDVPDSKQLKLAVLSPQQARQSSATTGFVEELLGRVGATFRTYRNTLVVLAADGAEAAALRERVKRYLALRAIQDDKALVRQLSEEGRRTLESKLKDAEGGIPFQVLSAYRHLAKAGEAGVEWLDLGLPTVGEKGPLARQVREYLKSQELLVDKLAPHRLLEKALRADEQEKPLAEIVEAFLRYPHLPMLEGEAVATRAVAQGVTTGLFGVRVGEHVYFGEPVPDAALGYGAVLLRKEVAEAARRAEAGEAVPTEVGGGDGRPSMVKEGPAGATAGPSTAPAGAAISALHLRAKVPWDKLSDFLRGVVLPLRGASRPRRWSRRSTRPCGRSAPRCWRSGRSEVSSQRAKPVRAMSRALLALDTDRIKDYVFATGVLRDIRGASAILDDLNRNQMERLVLHAAPAAATVYAHGGSGLFVVNSNHAEAARLAVQRRYLEATESASVSSAVAELPEMVAPAEDVHVLWRQLAYRLRAAKDRNPTAAELTAHALLQPCEACGLRYSTARWSGPEGEQRLCGSCNRKRKRDDRIRTQDIPRWLREPGLAAGDDAPLWHRLISSLRRAGYPLVAGLSRPEDFDTLAAASRPEGYMGLIYADGDGIGRELEQLHTLAEIGKLAASCLTAGSME